MYGRHGKMLMLLLGGCLVAGIAGASNITIPDRMTSPNPQYQWWDGGQGWGQAAEDQEVEPWCLTGQLWDLEGMFLGASPVTSDPDVLTLVGGWNFTGSTENYTSGDIFIALTEEPVYGNPAHSGTLMSAYRYDYVLDVNWGAGTYDVYTNAAGVDVSLVAYSQNYGSNPWARATDTGPQGTHVTSGTFSYVTGLTDSDTGFRGGAHNAASFDLSWLDTYLPSGGTDVWFHFTEQCGNDNLMGKVESGWDPGPAPQPVPEPASMGILGMGLLGLVTTRLRKK